MSMPDTKTGRERKGTGKRQQLEHHLLRRELEADDEPPAPADDAADAVSLSDTE